MKMGRVETRMYRNRRKKKQVVGFLLLMCICALAGVFALHHLRPGFISELIAPPSPTAVTADFDRTVERREITLEQEIWYAIQTGVFSAEESAVQKADAYTERGAPGTVIQEGEKWRVFIACYGDEADAASVQNRLEQNQRVDTYLYKWVCPELRLRLTGMAGQLDVVEAGFSMLNAAAAVLRDMAMNLDAGQVQTQEALAAVEELNGQIQLWADTTRRRFGSDLPTLVQSMLAIAQGWDIRYKTLMGNDRATMLSAALKAQAMGMFDEIVRWRKSVCDT